MGLDTNLLVRLKIKNFFSFRFSKSLFFRLGLMVSLFATFLIIIIYQVITLSYTVQDTILDAHEYYYYSQMVESWGVPPDTTKMLEDMENLQLEGCVFYVKEDSSIVWRHPKDFIPTTYISYSDNELLEEIWGVPAPNYISFGNMEELLTTYVEIDDYRYFLTIDYNEPSDFLLRFIPASLLTVFFGIILFFYINKYLQPIKLMRNRVYALEKGDLDSKIEIITKDELGLLSATINDMIVNIKSLLTQKQQLLSDISHELMSPLTRMRLLIELLPEHKNKVRINREIMNLRNMISNLLLSDKLDIPYTNLELTKIRFSDFLDKIIAKFPEANPRIKVMGEIPELEMNLDEVKIGIAVRNVIENAIKYGDSKMPIEISSSQEKDSITLSIHDYGTGIPIEEIQKITEPFYRVKDHKSLNITGFGLGLSITRKVIDAHKGHLLIDSELSKGTTFTISLPISL